MIDPKKETLISIAQARNEFPQRPSNATLWRWMLKGVRGASLESIKIGGRRFTSMEACQRFISDTTENRELEPKPTKRNERQSLIQAKLVLDQFGV